MMRSFATVSLLAGLVACGGSESPRTKTTTTTTTTDPTDPPPAAVAVTTERVVISNGRPSGTDTITVEPDGTIKILYDTLWNGRGPRTEATIVLAADGTLQSMTAKGHHWMRTPMEETFTRDGDRASWKSLEDEGETTASGVAFYLPLASLPDLDGLLVQAALRNGGTLPLLPSGEARVARGVEVAFRDRTLVLHEVSGIGLAPGYTWMNADGTWWGTVDESWSIVPKGDEAAIDVLLPIQNAEIASRDARLAKEHAHQPPAAGLAYTHARVLDVAKGKWLADQTVLIVGDRIKAVGSSKKVKLPDGVEIVDLAGKALVPGLIDMHAHMGDLSGPLNIASGVTTVRDLGNDPDFLAGLKRRYDDGTAIGPRIFRFGFIEGRGEKAATSKITAETEDEALAGVKWYVDHGYDGIKIYNSVPKELVPVITKAAHDAGLKVTGHVPVFMLAEDVVRDGYDGIEHINMLLLNFLATRETDTRDTTRFTLVGDKASGLDLKTKEVRAFIKTLADKKIVIDPTLTAFEDMLAGKPGEITPGQEALVARLPARMQRTSKLNGLPGQDVDLYRAAFETCLALVRALYEAKVPLVIGTDSLAGLVHHHEMALFVRAGVPTAAVLRMATIDAARILGADKDLGSIAAGKLADLVVIDGDPLKNIDDITRVVATVRGGVVYASAPLHRTLSITPVVE